MQSVVSYFYNYFFITIIIINATMVWWVVMLTETLFYVCNILLQSLIIMHPEEKYCYHARKLFIMGLFVNASNQSRAKH